MELLLKFGILKFNSYTLDDSGEAGVEAGGQPSSGKTYFTIMLTKFGQNLENLTKPLGFFSCELQTWHVKMRGFLNPLVAQAYQCSKILKPDLVPDFALIFDYLPIPWW